MVQNRRESDRCPPSVCQASPGWSARRAASPARASRTPLVGGQSEGLFNPAQAASSAHHVVDGEDLFTVQVGRALAPTSPLQRLSPATGRPFTTAGHPRPCLLRTSRVSAAHQELAASARTTMAACPASWVAARLSTPSRASRVTSTSCLEGRAVAGIWRHSEDSAPPCNTPPERARFVADAQVEDQPRRPRRRRGALRGPGLGRLHPVVVQLGRPAHPAARHEQRQGPRQRADGPRVGRVLGDLTGYTPATLTDRAALDTPARRGPRARLGRGHRRARRGAHRRRRAGPRRPR